MKYSQRDIVYISLNPTKGREQRGKRPAVIISDDAFHESGLCIVCPLTSTIRKLPGNVVVKSDSANKLKNESEILVGHIRSVSQERITSKIGVIQKTQLEAMFQGIDLLCNR
jgi:mRNA interferase MazF